MARMISMSHLPPPVTFTHGETLHAIALPPLASFLSSLSAPEHFITLQDLLDRYRTPKSYHRIDVRLVASSELPPEGPCSPQDQEDAEREKGEPIELPEGVQPVEPVVEPATSLPVNDIADHSAAVLADLTKDGERAPRNTSEIFAQITASQVSHDEGNRDLASWQPSALNPTIESLPSTPPPTHPLPPSGPTRRVRELRLDLRSLDAAALFHLETWRREVLGLKKLELDFPDSIWYKDPTPPPSPPPSVVRTAPKKLGRPRKCRLSEPLITTQDSLDNLGLDMVIDCADGIFTQEQTNGYESLVDALAENGAVPPGHNPEPDINSAPSLSHTTLGELAQQVIRVDYDAAQQPEQQAGPSPSESPRILLSPSPDIMLDDAFNEKENDDPDFIPPISPKIRTRKNGDPNAVKRKGRKSRVSFDLSNLMNNGTDGIVDIPGDMVNPAAVDEVGQQLPRRRGRPPKRVRGPGIQYYLAQIAAAKQKSPTVPAEGTPDVGDGEFRSRKREKIVNVEIPSKKRRISEVGPVKAASDEVVLTHGQTLGRHMGDSSDEEDEEWGFLKAIK